MKNTALMILLVALLFLPIRGGITVSAMNTGEVYSAVTYEIESCGSKSILQHNGKFEPSGRFCKQYRFMDGKRQINCLPK